MLVIATLPAIALWIGMNFMPESPRWLASMGSFGETLGVLQRIRSQAEARAEFEEVKAMAVEDYKSKMGSWKDLSVPWLRRIFVVGIGLAVIQQITGVNSIMYYGTQILAESGFGREAALTRQHRQRRHLRAGHASWASGCWARWGGAGCSSPARSEPRRRCC